MCRKQTTVSFVKAEQHVQKTIPNLQLIPGLFVLDPDFSLSLGVNQEREACSLGGNNAILNGQIIIGEPL